MLQALHTAYQETCGDCPDTIAKDREEADIIKEAKFQRETLYLINPKKASAPRARPFRKSIKRNSIYLVPLRKQVM